MQDEPTPIEDELIGEPSLTPPGMETMPALEDVPADEQLAADQVDDTLVMLQTLAGYGIPEADLAILETVDPDTLELMVSQWPDADADQRYVLMKDAGVEDASWIYAEAEQDVVPLSPEVEAGEDGLDETPGPSSPTVGETPTNDEPAVETDEPTDVADGEYPIDEVELPPQEGAPDDVAPPTGNGLDETPESPDGSEMPVPGESSESSTPDSAQDPVQAPVTGEAPADESDSQPESPVDDQVSVPDGPIPTPLDIAPPAGTPSGDPPTETVSAPTAEAESQPEFSGDDQLSDAPTPPSLGAEPPAGAGTPSSDLPIETVSTPPSGVAMPEPGGDSTSPNEADVGNGLGERLGLESPIGSIEELPQALEAAGGSIEPSDLDLGELVQLLRSGELDRIVITAEDGSLILDLEGGAADFAAAADLASELGGGLASSSLVTPPGASGDTITLGRQLGLVTVAGSAGYVLARKKR